MQIFPFAVQPTRRPLEFKSYYSPLSPTDKGPWHCPKAPNGSSRVGMRKVFTFVPAFPLDNSYRDDSSVPSCDIEEHMDLTCPTLICPVDLTVIRSANDQVPLHAAIAK